MMTMKQLAKTKSCIILCPFIAVLLIIAGCSSSKSKAEQYAIANLDKPPPQLHTYIVNATSAQDINALNDAANAAVKFCTATKERTEILEYRTQYQGLTPEQKNIISKADTIFGETTKTVSNTDYKIIVRFRCLPHQKEQSLIRAANQESGVEVIKY